MRFEIDLKNYTITPPPPYIAEVTLANLDFKQLSNEIDEFNREIEWDEMWTVDQAKDRLSNNWRLVVFRPGSRIIKGWYWLDNTKEPRNIYVNRNYRNMGVAREMQIELLNICKRLGMDRIECGIDDWNVISMKSFKSIGWTEVKFS